MRFSETAIVRRDPATKRLSVDPNLTRVGSVSSVRRLKKDTVLDLDKLMGPKHELGLRLDAQFRAKERLSKISPVVMRLGGQEHAEYGDLLAAKGRGDFVGALGIAQRIIRLEKASAGWIRCTRGQYLDVWKGAGHKYVKRVRYTDRSGKQRYRYYYKVSQGQGVGHEDHMKVGSAFAYDGGHYHVTAVRGDKVTIVHDETGFKKKLSRRALAELLKTAHADAIQEHKDKLKSDLMDAAKYGTRKQLDRLAAEAEKWGVSLTVDISPEDVETINEPVVGDALTEKQKRALKALEEAARTLAERVKRESDEADKPTSEEERKRHDAVKARGAAAAAAEPLVVHEEVGEHIHGAVRDDDTWWRSHRQELEARERIKKEEVFKQFTITDHIESGGTLGAWHVKNWLLTRVRATVKKSQVSDYLDGAEVLSKALERAKTVGDVRSAMKEMDRWGIRWVGHGENLHKPPEGYTTGGSSWSFAHGGFRTFWVDTSVSAKKNALGANINKVFNGASERFKEICREAGRLDRDNISVAAYRAKTEGASTAGKAFSLSSARVIKEPERVGGADIEGVTSGAVHGEMVAAHFGFRNIDYGNWATQKERALHLKGASTGFSDLSDILGVPPSSIAQDIGRTKGLGIAFGARGRSRAVAHYESDQEVINMTKFRGGGALAHEWGHFMDNVVVASGGFATERYHALPERSKTAMRSLLGAMMATTFARDAKALDKKKSGAYWSDRKEMFARLFETWVQDELKSKGRVNTYLTHGTDMQFYTAVEVQNPWDTADPKLAELQATLDSASRDFKGLKNRVAAGAPAEVGSSELQRMLWAVKQPEVLTAVEGLKAAREDVRKRETTLKAEAGTRQAQPYPHGDERAHLGGLLRNLVEAFKDDKLIGKERRPELVSAASSPDLVLSPAALRSTGSRQAYTQARMELDQAFKKTRSPGRRAGALKKIASTLPPDAAQVLVWAAMKSQKSLRGYAHHFPDLTVKIRSLSKAGATRSNVMKSASISNLLAQGWIECSRDDALAVWKGAGHKYVKRVPYTKKDGKRGYRYFYKVSHGKGVGHEDHIVEGAAFMHAGGHYHVTKVKGGLVTVRHDETGKTKTVDKTALKGLLEAHHADAIKEHKDKLEQEHADAQQYGSEKQKERARKRAEAAGVLNKEDAAPKKQYGNLAEVLRREAAEKKHPVDFELARRAYAGTSHTPEKRARQEQNGYMNHIEEVAAESARLAELNPDKADDLRDALKDYIRGYKIKNDARLRARAEVVSPLVTGPANFPAKRNQKKNEIADRRTREQTSWEAWALAKMRSMASGGGNARVSSDRSDAVSVLNDKIEAAEKHQAHMKAVNRIVRSKKGTDDEKKAKLKEMGVSGSLANVLLAPNYRGKATGYESYQLTNNNANIKRMKERAAAVGAEQAKPTSSHDFDGGTVVDNADNNRVQIVFDSKPDAEQRQRLKRNGFRWSPSEGAWQRHRNNAGRHAVVAIIGSNPWAKKAGSDSPDVLKSAGWIECSRADALAVWKGAGHKYIKRVPYTKPNGKKGYRYYYKVTHGRGVGHEDHMKVGSAFMHDGGHYHITGESGDLVTIVHDETGKKKTVNKQALQKLLEDHHAEAIGAHKERVAQEHADAQKYGSKRQKDLARKRAEAAGVLEGAKSPEANAQADKQKQEAKETNLEKTTRELAEFRESGRVKSALKEMKALAHAATSLTRRGEYSGFVKHLEWANSKREMEAILKLWEKHPHEGRDLKSAKRAAKLREGVADSAHAVVDPGKYTHGRYSNESKPLNLKSARRRLDTFSSGDETRPELTVMHRPPGEDFAYATDGHRLVRVPVDSSVPEGDSVTGKRSVLSEREFPAQHLPGMMNDAQSGSRHVIDAEKVHHLAHAALKLAHPDKNGATASIVILHSDGENLRLSGGAPGDLHSDREHTGTHVAAGSSGLSEPLAFDAKYLIDALKGARGSVTIYVPKDAKTGMLIHRPDGEEHLIMPRRDEDPEIVKRGLEVKPSGSKPAAKPKKTAKTVQPAAKPKKTAQPAAKKQAPVAYDEKGKSIGREPQREHFPSDRSWRAAHNSWTEEAARGAKAAARREKDRQESEAKDKALEGYRKKYGEHKAEMKKHQEVAKFYTSGYAKHQTGFNTIHHRRMADHYESLASAANAKDPDIKEMWLRAAKQDKAEAEEMLGKLETLKKDMESAKAEHLPKAREHRKLAENPGRGSSRYHWAKVDYHMAKVAGEYEEADQHYRRAEKIKEERRVAAEAELAKERAEEAQRRERSKPPAPPKKYGPGGPVLRPKVGQSAKEKPAKEKPAGKKPADGFVDDRARKDHLVLVERHAPGIEHKGGHEGAKDRHEEASEEATIANNPYLAAYHEAMTEFHEKQIGMIDARHATGDKRAVLEAASAKLLRKADEAKKAHERRVFKRPILKHPGKYVVVHAEGSGDYSTQVWNRGAYSGVGPVSNKRFRRQKDALAHAHKIATAPTAHYRQSKLAQKGGDYMDVFKAYIERRDGRFFVKTGVNGRVIGSTGTEKEAYRMLEQYRSKTTKAVEFELLELAAEVGPETQHHVSKAGGQLVEVFEEVCKGDPLSSADVIDAMLRESVSAYSDADRVCDQIVCKMSLNPNAHGILRQFVSEFGMDGLRARARGIHAAKKMLAEKERAERLAASEADGRVASAVPTSLPGASVAWGPNGLA